MVKTANEVFRDFETDGVPASGEHEPIKADIREMLMQLQLYSGTSAPALIFQTRANLYADLTRGASTMAWVIADPTAAYNGIYQKQGAANTGSWTRLADLPYSFIQALDAGVGTPDAIQATTPIPVSASALIILNIFEDNVSSPVTVSFNGGSVLTIKSNTGNQIVAGGLVAGMRVFGIIIGSEFRLISDQVSGAIVAAAEDAETLAEAWADNDEDDPVTTGPDKFSAKHWALKAEDSVAGVPPPTGFLKGCQVANDAVTPNTKITVAAGIARDDADTETMFLLTGLLKRVNTAFAVGNDAGSLDTGAYAANTWYHVFIIYNPTTDVTEVLTSISLTNPVLPSGFTKFRRVWSILSNASSIVEGFIQTGDECRWKASVQTISSANDGGNVGRLRIVPTPPGLKTEAILLHFVVGAVSFNAGLYDPDVNAGAVYQAITVSHYLNINTVYIVRCFTNVNSQVGSYSGTANAADSVISIIGLGYKDDRGKRI